MWCYSYGLYYAILLSGSLPGDNQGNNQDVGVGVGVVCIKVSCNQDSWWERGVTWMWHAIMVN